MIYLTDTLAIKADAHCYIVGKPATDATNRITMREATYHLTMDKAVENAILRLLRKDVADERITTLRQYADELESWRNRMAELLQPVTETEGQPT